MHRCRSESLIMLRAHAPLALRFRRKGSVAPLGDRHASIVSLGQWVDALRFAPRRGSRYAWYNLNASLSAATATNNFLVPQSHYIETVTALPERVELYLICLEHFAQDWRSARLLSASGRESPRPPCIPTPMHVPAIKSAP